MTLVRFSFDGFQVQAGECLEPGGHHLLEKVTQADNILNVNAAMVIKMIILTPHNTHMYCKYMLLFMSKFLTSTELLSQV